jgi:hypothetical protein
VNNIRAISIHLEVINSMSAIAEHLRVRKSATESAGVYWPEEFQFSPTLPPSANFLSA